MSKSGVTYVNPPSAGPAQGMYSHVARMTPGEVAFIAGQVAIDAKGTPVGVGDVAAQVPVVFDNLGKILKDLGKSDLALKISRSVGPDWVNWSRDHQAIESARQKLGEAINEIMNQRQATGAAPAAADSAAARQ